jgi:hypothetical protein
MIAGVCATCISPLRLVRCAVVLKPGDKVRLVTGDETVHEFRVTQLDLDEGLINGKDASVRIAEIVGVATREAAVGKTVCLTVGISTGVFLGLLLAAGYTLAL